MFNQKEYKREYKLKIKNEKILSWTKDKCISVASSCKSEIEFREKFTLGYRISVKNGWLSDIILDIKKLHPFLSWSTKEVFHNISIKYDNRRDFRRENRGIYETSRLNNWLDEICLHMDRLIKPSGFWTKEVCRNISSNFNTKSEFRKNNSVAYDRASRNGWIDEICLHMEIIGNRYNRCVYAYEFSDNCVYVGLTYNLSERHRHHNINSVINNSAVFRHVQKTSLVPTLIQISEYISVKDASELEGIKVDEYRKNGWNILNVSKTGSVGSLPYKSFKIT